MITLMALAALLAGVLVSLSRALNGRLSLATSPLTASLWNHLVGFCFLAVLAVFLGDAWPEGSGWLPDAPVRAWAGGPVGVAFVALGSLLVTRIGAALTAMLVIAGQMISGIALDLARGVPTSWALQVAGVVLILGGMWLFQRRR